VDLDTLKRFSSGDLSPKEYLAVHLEAGELLDTLNDYLHPGEFVVMLSDWPVVRRRAQYRQYAVLKTMMLATPLVIVGGTVFALHSPLAALFTGMAWLFIFTVIAILQLLRRLRKPKSTEGRSVVAVTNRRIMRIWLDGSGEVQSWLLNTEKRDQEPMEPVPETVQLLLRLELGKTSLN
jgi:hypothetical protein